VFPGIDNDLKQEVSASLVRFAIRPSRMMTLRARFAGSAGEGQKYSHYASKEWNVSPPVLHASYVLVQGNIRLDVFRPRHAPARRAEIHWDIASLPLRRGCGLVTPSVSGSRPDRRARSPTAHYTKGRRVTRRTGEILLLPGVPAGRVAYQEEVVAIGPENIGIRHRVYERLAFSARPHLAPKNGRKSSCSPAATRSAGACQVVSRTEQGCGCCREGNHFQFR
jgi:hypothetical protein